MSRDLNLERKEENLVGKSNIQFASAESCWKVNGLGSKTGKSCTDDSGIRFNSLKGLL